MVEEGADDTQYIKKMFTICGEKVVSMPKRRRVLASNGTMNGFLGYVERIPTVCIEVVSVGSQTILRWAV